MNNDIHGLKEREEYIESLIAKLDNPDIIVLPELSQTRYIGNTDIWKYADKDGKRINDDFFNAYLIAGELGVFGKVFK